MLLFGIKKMLEMHLFGDPKVIDICQRMSYDIMSTTYDDICSRNTFYCIRHIMTYVVGTYSMFLNMLTYVVGTYSMFLLHMSTYVVDIMSYDIR